jgi:hypothetical protein
MIAWLVSALAALAGWHRLPLDGAPVEALWAASGDVAAVVGLAGLYRTDDGGQHWRRDLRLDPMTLGCGEMALTSARDGLVFRCNLPSGGVHCVGLAEQATRTCSPREQGRQPVAPPPQVPKPLRRQLHLDGPQAPRLLLVRQGQVRWLGVGRLGVLRSPDGGKTWAWRVAGMDGLAAARIQRNGDDERLVSLAAPTVEALVHDGQPWVVVGQASCRGLSCAWLERAELPTDALRFTPWPLSPEPEVAGLPAVVPRPLFSTRGGWLGTVRGVWLP